jgi:hypothetical protein
MKIAVRCSWCAPADRSAHVSHGICPDHLGELVRALASHEPLAFVLGQSPATTNHPSAGISESGDPYAGPPRRRR